VLQSAKHYEWSFFKYGVAEEALHYWQFPVPPSHCKQLGIIPVCKHLKFMLS